MKKNRIILALLTTFMALSIIFFDAPNAMAASGTVKSVKVTNLPAKTLTLKKGGSKKLKVKVTTKGKSASKKVTYKSSKPSVATVDSKGKVVGKKNGKAKITIASAANSKKKVVINVTVGTPVTSVSLDKTSVTLQQGATATLKATVKPKKPSNKKVIWTSSNQKVATVSNTGAVKAVAPGTANITATAADGSGKKKTATVVVQNNVTISSVSVVNQNTVQVVLSGAQKLAASNFTVKVNSSGKGSYNKVCKIDNISTSNNQVYLLVLESDSRIYNLEGVQVTVSGLSGTGTVSKTTTYDEGKFKYTSTEIFTATHNQSLGSYYYLDLDNGVGYSAYTVQGLPQGITSELSYGYRVRFRGTPTQKGKVTSTLVATDEVGNITTYSIIWLIGSSDTISAAASPIYTRLSSGSAYIDAEVEVTGGSGSYSYSISGNNYGLSINSYGEITGTLNAAGTYTLTVNIEDNNNPTYKTTTDVVINVSSSITISGIVKDQSGNPIPYADVEFENKDKANKYSSSPYTYCNSEGAYSISLVPGTYDIEAYAHNSHKYLYSQSLTTTRSGFDITLPIQKVAITSNNASISDFETWYDKNGTEYGSGNVLWLKNGTYSLTSTWNSGRKVITATLNVTVSAATNSAVASVSIEESDANVSGNITVGTPVPVVLTGSYKYYTFTPAESGTYYFYSTSNEDTYGCLEDADSELTNNDDAGSGENFYFSYLCEAGTTYYVGIKAYSSGTTGAATLYVTNEEPSFVDDEDYDADDDYSMNVSEDSDPIVQENADTATNTTSEIPETVSPEEDVTDTPEEAVPEEDDDVVTEEDVVTE